VRAVGDEPVEPVGARVSPVLKLTRTIADLAEVLHIVLMFSGSICQVDGGIPEVCSKLHLQSGISLTHLEMIENQVIVGVQ
jgi:hypothetical protein